MKIRTIVVSQGEYELPSDPEELKELHGVGTALSAAMNQADYYQKDPYTSIEHAEEIKSITVQLIDSHGVVVATIPAISDPNPSESELDFVKDGNTIAAVKAYRERTGASLKDAVEIIKSTNEYKVAHP